MSIGVLYDFAAYIGINFCATVSKTPTTTTTIIIMSAEGLPTGLLGAEPDADFVDNYEMLTGDDSQYTLSEKMVHHCGGAILPVHWIACKAVLAFASGSGVSKLKTTTKAKKADACLELYYNTIEALDEEFFDKDARDFFCNSFQKKEEPMPAPSLYRYYQDIRCKIRNQLLPCYPRDLVMMKSGCGFHETCADVYVKAYREEMSMLKLRNGNLKYTAEEIAEMLPPQHWEFKKNPWYFGLLIKIFRRDPQLALDVPNVMKDPANVPVGRAVLRREAQLKARRLNGAGTPTARTDATTPSPPTDSSVVTSNDSVSTPRDNTSMATTTGAHHDKLMWAKVMASKAHAEATNIAKRMGKIEELEKGMALLEKMRPVIGEELYANEVRSLFAALPNFKTFDSAVDIIDVDSTVPAVGDHNNWRTTKRRLSSNDEDDYDYADRSKKQKTTRTSTGCIADGNVGSPAASPSPRTASGVAHAAGLPSSESDEDADDDEEEENVEVINDDDHDLYVTYEDITDENGKVVGVRAYDARYPDDAEPNQTIGGWVRKDKDGNVIERTYDDYVKTTTTK